MGTDRLRIFFLNILQNFIFALNIGLYYTTLLKSVQITSKTSTNIQRYSDSWLFVHFRFDEFFLANQIASTRKYFMYAN